MSEPQSVKNAYILTGESDVSRSLAQRTLTHDVVYIVPYLDSLPPDFVFCDIGCGPGSISLDVAQRYPRCTVLGVDASQSDIKVSPGQHSTAGEGGADGHRSPKRAPPSARYPMRSSSLAMPSTSSLRPLRPDSRLCAAAVTLCIATR